jgi:electron transport complex protein RnfC
MASERREFPAGLVLDAHKRQALEAPIVPLPAPASVALALDQGSGSVLEPVVAVGQDVALGAIVARAIDPFGATLHASVSGRVTAIETRESASESGECVCIELANDGREALEPGSRPDEAFTLEPPELVERLRGAGIAGLGGAAFPTATKLAAARERGARRLLLNGAECEPWICCDDALMRAEAGEIVFGARVLMRALDADECVIAVEDDKPQAIEALRQAVATTEAGGVAVEVVPAVYPRGAERQLISAVMGVEVPARGLPAEVGLTCQNVATAAAVARWARTGEPCLSRVVTVTGSGVARPVNVRARLGTPIAALVAAAGGYRGDPLRLIAGGSMTGRALTSDEVGLTKAINCVLVATREDLSRRLDAYELPCIRCGDCATVCPPGLLPQQIHRAVLAGQDEAAVTLGVWECIDCGCCDYVCPSQIPLALRFREARARLRDREAATARAAVARDRFERHERRLHEAALAEQRAFDAARALARGSGDQGSTS